MEGVTATTKKTDSARYDRQLRLWGEEGQAKLEDAHVCLINATATGAETLKNLVLPGIGKFTIVDNKKISDSDFNNFFIVESSSGKSRAAVTCELLRELNDLADGSFDEKDPIDLINNNPAYFKQFTVIIANDVPDEPLLKLSKFCWENSIVLVVTNAYGFIGYIRLCIPEHAVIESKPDNPPDDLRLANPFPELQAYADSIDLKTLNSTEYSHVPFPILLLHHTKKWKETHDGKLPQNYAEKTAFRNEILKGSKNQEANFDEAYKAYFKALAATQIPSNTQAILNDPKCANPPSDSKFWILAKAVKEFIENKEEGNGYVPLPGAIPDMTATTNGYIAIQKLYQDKATRDSSFVHQRASKILQSLGKSADWISLDEVKKFCKNINLLQLVRFTTLEKEYDSSYMSSKSSYFNSELNNPESSLIWYIMLRAARRFHNKYGRYPGQQTNSVKEDVSHLKTCLTQLLSEWGINSTIEYDNYCQEIVRYGASEIHTIASLMGGVASQEIIKLITHQYLPVANTFIYNGNNSTSLSWTV